MISISLPGSTSHILRILKPGAFRQVEVHSHSETNSLCTQDDISQNSSRLVGNGGSGPICEGLRKLCKYGQLDEALQTMGLTYQEGICVPYSTFYYLLQVCINKKDLAAGRRVLCFLMRSGFEVNAFLGSHLIRMFAVCGSLSDANQVFSKLAKPNMFAWSAIIAANAKLGDSERAIRLYKQMQQLTVCIDEFVFVAVLKACANMEALEQGKMIHTQIFLRGFELVDIVGNTLIDMYAKCGSLKAAYRLFNKLSKKDTVTWNAMISGYALHGHCEAAVLLFQQMQKEGVQPDNVTYVGILKSCSCANALKQGKLIHSLIIETSIELSVSIGSILIDLYSKCGSLEDAHQVFSLLRERNAVTWTAMIAGHFQHACSQEALQLFHQMQQEGIRPDIVTIITILQACSENLALDEGKLIHAYTIVHGIESDSSVGSALIDMYFKCGYVEGACRVFDKFPKRNVVTWNAMIAGYAQHSAYMLSLQCFHDMQGEGSKPDDVSFVSLLSACSRVGFVDRGFYYFHSMRADHGITPTHDHYVCMVDLLGRAGHLKDAEILLQTMPFQPCIEGWRSLLSHCRTCGNLELARRCFDHTFVMDTRDSTAYVLMSNVYADAGMWAYVDNMEEWRNYVYLWKKPAKALIEVGKKVHAFSVGDKSHPKFDNIQGKLDSLSWQMEEEGYVPLVDFGTAK